MPIQRRALLGAAALAALPWDLARAQGTGGVLRLGMTASAVPLSNGCPDQGAEGQRFMGITLYDQLVEWDLSKADAPAVLTPGLATSWAVDPANPKRWVFTLRQGVKFHDGKVMDSADIVFSFDRAFKKGDPAYDARAAAQVGLRLPTAASWGTDGPDKFWLETSIVDSTVPYGVTWVGITSAAGVGGGGPELGRLSQPRRGHRALGSCRPSPCGSARCCCATPTTGTRRGCRNARSSSCCRWGRPTRGSPRSAPARWT